MLRLLFGQTYQHRYWYRHIWEYYYQPSMASLQQHNWSWCDENENPTTIE